MPATQQVILKSAQMYANLLIKLQEGVSVLREQTLISSASRLAGTFMFRSIPLNLGNAPPGQMVIVPGVKEKAEDLTNLITVTVKQLGKSIDDAKAMAALDPASISSISVLETQTRFEPMCRATAKTIGLSLPEAAACLAVASALLVNETSRNLDIHRGYITAIWGVHEGMKYVPARLSDESK